MDMAPHKQHARPWLRLPAAYGFALLSIALLVLVGQLVVQRAFNDVAAGRAMLEALRLQITVSDEVLGYAVGIQKITSREEPTQLLLALRSAMTKWESSHANLQSAEEDLRASNRGSVGAEQSFAQAETSYGIMGDIARSLLAAASPDAQSQSPQVDQLVRKLALSESAYVDALKDVYRLFEEENQRTLARARSEELALAFAVLLLIALEAVFLIGPAHRASSRHLERSVRAQELGARLGAEMARRAAEREMREMEAQFQTLFRHSSAGVALLDEQGRILDSNLALQQLLGYSAREMVNARFEDWLYRESVEGQERNERVRRDPPDETSGPEKRYVCKDGRVIWAEATISPIQGSDGLGALSFGTLQDRSERKQAEMMLRYDATHDLLTAVYNRKFFEQSLERAYDAAAAQPTSAFAVLVIDLDQFKYINDSRSHAFGDAVLVETARRIQACIRPNDVVARFGGDEFGVLLTDSGDATTVLPVVERLERELSRPMSIEGRVVATTVSIGVAYGSSPVSCADDVLRSADAAVHRAKVNGRACHVVFDQEMVADSRKRVRIGTELPFAFERSQLRLVYQPVFDVRTNRCVGFESLLRWSHPDLGDVPPTEFISVAEGSGLILRIDHFVLSEACRQLADWLRRYPGIAAGISVNVSAQQFAQPNFRDELATLLRETGVDGRRLTLELTETAMLDSARLASNALPGIKDLGVRLSLDDFGTGYSSLSYLHKYPIDALKIDRSFISGRGMMLASPPIASSLLALADSLKIDVVTEGVETRAQLTALTSMGCKFVQGFLLSKPLELPEAEVLVARMAAHDSLTGGFGAAALGP